MTIKEFIKKLQKFKELEDTEVVVIKDGMQVEPKIEFLINEKLFFDNIRKGVEKFDITKESVGRVIITGKDK